MNSFMRDGIEFRFDKHAKGETELKYGSIRVGGTCLSGMYWEPIVHIEGIEGRSDHLIQGLPIVLTQMTENSDKLDAVLGQEKFRYLNQLFKKYPRRGGGSCQRKRFIQMGKASNPGPDDGLIMDLIRVSVNW